MPFWSHFTEEETETQRKEGACQGHAVGFVAEPGFERNVARPSRRALWRGGLHGTGHADLVAMPPEPWLLCSQQSWGSPPPWAFPGLLRRDRELPCSPRPQLQASMNSPTSSRRTSLSARRGTPCDCPVWGCDEPWPWEGFSAGPWRSLGPRCWGLGKEWGGQAGVPRGRSRLRIPRALAESTALGWGFGSRGLRPPVVDNGLDRNLSSAWPAGFDEVGI